MLFAFAEKHRYPACCGEYQAADSLPAHSVPCSTMLFRESPMPPHLPGCCSDVPGKPWPRQQTCPCPACRAQVKATYLLSGWTSEKPRRHVVHLVAPEQLSTARQALQPVTSMHVYSVQPSAPKVRGCVEGADGMSVQGRRVKQSVPSASTRGQPPLNPPAAGWRCAVLCPIPFCVSRDAKSKPSSNAHFQVCSSGHILRDARCKSSCVRLQSRGQCCPPALA